MHKNGNYIHVEDMKLVNQTLCKHKQVPGVIQLFYLALDYITMVGSWQSLQVTHGRMRDAFNIAVHSHHYCVDTDLSVQILSVIFWLNEITSSKKTLALICRFIFVFNGVVFVIECSTMVNVWQAVVWLVQFVMLGISINWIYWSQTVDQYAWIFAGYL